MPRAPAGRRVQQRRQPGGSDGGHGDARTLKAEPDSISSYYALTAGVAGRPVTVAFALRAPGGGWCRLEVDDSAPYRAFVDPRRYRKGARVQVVAISRGFDGATSVSKVLTVKPNP